MSFEYLDYFYAKRRWHKLQGPIGHKFYGHHKWKDNMKHIRRRRRYAFFVLRRPRWQ